MPEVNVEINGRKYRMACEPGQEQHLLDLAARFNGYIEALRGAFGEIGDNRLTIMAGIAALDELGEAQKQVKRLTESVDELTRTNQALAEESEAMQGRFASKLAETSGKIEAIAQAIDETMPLPSGGN